MSNVSALVEMADLRDAQRAYEANLNVVESARSMMMGVVDVVSALAMFSADRRMRTVWARRPLAAADMADMRSDMRLS
jgi:hypothetical protein